MAEVTTILAVPDVHCDHCKESIEAAVGALAGVAGVEVDLPGRVVTVRHDPGRAPTSAVVGEVEGQGYEVAARDEVA